MTLPIARILSYIFNPLSVIVLVPFFLIYKTTGDLLIAFNWTVYTILFLLCMAVFLIYMVRKGKFTDLDVSKKEQRPLLFLVSIVLAVFYLAGLMIFKAPSIMMVVTIGVIIGILLASVINIWIKASIHVATISALIVALVLVYGGFYYFLLLIIPIMAFIRVRAKRHTISETIAGAIFGMSISLLAYIVVTSFSIRGL